MIFLSELNPSVSKDDRRHTMPKGISSGHFSLTCERLHSSVLYFHQLPNNVLDPCVTFTKFLSMNEQLAGAGVST